MSKPHEPMHQGVEEVLRKAVKNPQNFGKFEIFYHGWDTVARGGKCAPPSQYKGTEAHLWREGAIARIAFDAREKVRAAQREEKNAT